MFYLRCSFFFILLFWQSIRVQFLSWHDPISTLCSKHKSIYRFFLLSGWFILIFGVIHAKQRKKKLLSHAADPMFLIYEICWNKVAFRLNYWLSWKMCARLKMCRRRKQWNLNASLIKFIFRIVVPSKIRQNVSFSIIQFECFIMGYYPDEYGRN